MARSNKLSYCKCHFLFGIELLMFHLGFLRSSLAICHIHLCVLWSVCGFWYSSGLHQFLFPFQFVFRCISFIRTSALHFMTQQHAFTWDKRFILESSSLYGDQGWRWCHMNFSPKKTILDSFEMQHTSALCLWCFLGIVVFPWELQSF